MVASAPPALAEIYVMDVLWKFGRRPWLRLSHLHRTSLCLGLSIGGVFSHGAGAPGLRAGV